MMMIVMVKVMVMVNWWIGDGDGDGDGEGELVMVNWWWWWWWHSPYLSSFQVAWCINYPLIYFISLANNILLALRHFYVKSMFPFPRWFSARARCSRMFSCCRYWRFCALRGKSRTCGFGSLRGDLSQRVRIYFSRELGQFPFAASDSFLYLVHDSVYLPFAWLENVVSYRILDSRGESICIIVHNDE